MSFASLHRRAILLGLAALPLTSGFALAGQPAIWSDAKGKAIAGYDPVAYFEAGEAVEGSDEHRASSIEHQVTWQDAVWNFSSAENKAKFEADPEAYAPQFGGYCAYAVSKGKTAKIDPQAWDIVDGKLYLNYSKTYQKIWQLNRASHIKSAEENWPKVLEE